MTAEMLEVTDYLMAEVEVVEKELDLGYPFPLRLHSRYNRDQIMAALRLHMFESASSNREGVARQQALNTEALFITLNKSEKEYSPSTTYEDYALNEYLFHCNRRTVRHRNRRWGCLILSTGKQARRSGSIPPSYPG
jgi:hypothetical protein